MKSKTKTCARCKEDKPIGEFGRNKYYIKFGAKDGRAIYCKQCNLRATHFQRGRRSALPVYEPSRQRMVIAKKRPRKSDLEKVLDAVAAGNRTREAIAAATRLPIEHASNLLAQLMFDQSAIRIVRRGEEREFHLNQKAA